MNRVLSAVALALLACLHNLSGAPVGQNLGANITVEETAKIIVNDRFWGNRAIEKAIEYGDKIIPLIKKESQAYKKLDNRNSFWIAETLGSIDSKLSRETLFKLYHLDDEIPTLVGSIGLCMQGVYPDKIDKDSILVKTVKNAKSQTATQLAIIALGYSGSIDALSALHEVLSKRPSAYWNHAYACEAVARIRSVKSITILRECIQSSEFYALPEAYRAAISLGDKGATILAIARISEDIKGTNTGCIIDELELVTGLKHGYNKEKWEVWWKEKGKLWKIPSKFLATWDKQPQSRKREE